MNFFKYLFLITVLAMGLALSIAAITPNDPSAEAGADLATLDDDSFELADDQESSSQLGRSRMGMGMGRFLAQKGKRRRRITCDKYPRICHSKGSPGPHCCKKKCVDVRKDRLNCGMCGKKCKYNEMCCNGKCINPSFNKRHCGGCNNKCGTGTSCVLGLCNYSN